MSKILRVTLQTQTFAPGWRETQTRSFVAEAGKCSIEQHQSGVRVEYVNGDAAAVLIVPWANIASLLLDDKPKIEVPKPPPAPKHKPLPDNPDDDDE